MRRSGLFLCIALAVALPPAGRAQPAVSDPDVVKGIQLVEDGDYDGAILTLDNAARRLAAEPAKVRELSQAYLYLGIAYLGKGHEAAAKAKFREAVSHIRDLSLSPDKFSPRVIDLFEAAKAEVARVPAPAASPSPEPPEEKSKKKGGSQKGLYITGGALALGGGAALLFFGGDGKGVKTETFTGELVDGDDQDHPITVEGTGTLEASLTWTSRGPAAELIIELKTPEFDLLATSDSRGPTAAQLTFAVSPGPYLVRVDHDRSCGGCVASYNLTVRHP